MRAGKPQKQAVAIAYSEKRAAKKASGGDVRPESYSPHSFDSDVDYYESLKKSRPTTKQIPQPRSKGEEMNPAQERKLREQEARMAKQKPMSKSESYDFLKQVREGLEKSFEKKAKGGKVKHHNW